MKILIIPDVHLKPWMFTKAEQIGRKEQVDRYVCLGDLVDDWECENNAQIYQKTLDETLSFAEKHTDTLWCYGNHDLAYLWNVYVTGTSGDDEVRSAAVHGLMALYNSIPAGKLAFVHRIDKVLFSHGGLSRMFVREHVRPSDYEKTGRALVDQIIIN